MSAPDPRPAPDAPELPAGPAWFAHRVGDAPPIRDARGIDPDRRLGIVDPATGAFVSIGAHDEVARLATGGLSAEELTSLLRAGTPLDPASIRFDVPVARPSKILCLGKNFAAHAAEFGAAVPDEPLFFTKLVDTLLPHGGTVLLPHWVDSRIDHEIELGVILGFDDPEARGRRDVSVDAAMDLVAGYTILDDVTARRMQGDDRGAQKPWLRCKSFDTFCPIGPWVVPKGAIDPHDLAIDLWVGDEHRQSSHTAKMVVDVPHAIAWLSKHTTLRPGDLIAMGTPEGVGPLREGDRCVGRIEGIGLLVHDVARGSPG